MISGTFPGGGISKGGKNWAIFGLQRTVFEICMLEGDYVGTKSMSPLISCQTRDCIYTCWSCIAAWDCPATATTCSSSAAAGRPTACTVSYSPIKCTPPVCGRWSVGRSRVHAVHSPRVWAHSSSSSGVGLHNSCMPTYGPRPCLYLVHTCFPRQHSRQHYVGGLHPTNVMAGWRGAVCPRSHGGLLVVA